ncbi:MAG: hypothetical protein KJ718_03090 [Nanoarchaeota archaeon]|nr:hypothetical protein [Nanoarchaeota archaeon]MBU1051515.1 hypothetical protein [Nanoarchaeota archaeon]MBU1988963.1 hypothetical protein [Nanoarchaeota archaeon]
MDRRGKITLIAVFLVIAILAVGFAIANPGVGVKKACMDGSDNDGDGYIDWPDDSGCANKQDDSELNLNVECDDGSDNDGDNAIDYNDAGCSGPTDNDETNCGDRVCEGGEVCDVCVDDCGVCNTCSDTDGGIYSLVFGTTSGYYLDVWYSHDDYCVDSSNLNEYYCSGDYEYGQQIFCGNDTYGSPYCSGGDVYIDFIDYLCSSGECDSTTAQELLEECDYGCTSGECDSIPDSCDDTDGGFVLTLQGTVSGYSGGSPYNYTDYCVNNSTAVHEYYCSGASVYGFPAGCVGNITTQCLNGACV